MKMHDLAIEIYELHDKVEAVKTLEEALLLDDFIDFLFSASTEAHGCAIAPHILELHSEHLGRVIHDLEKEA